MPRPPPPRYGLEHDCGARSQRGEEGLRLFEARRPIRALDDGHAEPLGQRPRPRLVAKALQGLRRRTDKDEACFGRGAGEGGVLAQETVAGMDGVAFGCNRCGDQPADVEVGADAFAGKGDGLVGPLDMQRPRVVRRVGGDRDDPQFRRGARDPDRDFAPVGDEQASDRGGAGSESHAGQRFWTSSRTGV